MTRHREVTRTAMARWIKDCRQRGAEFQYHINSLGHRSLSVELYNRGVRFYHIY